MENLRQVSFDEFNFANIVWSSKNKSTFYCCLSMNFSITTIKLLATSFWIIKILLWWDVSKHQIHFCIGVVKYCNCSVNGDSKHTTAICKVNYFKIWVQYMVSEIVKAHFKIEIPQLQSEFPKSIGSCHLIWWVR